MPNVICPLVIISTNLRDRGCMPTSENKLIPLKHFIFWVVLVCTQKEKGLLVCRGEYVIPFFHISKLPQFNKQREFFVVCFATSKRQMCEIIIVCVNKLYFKSSLVSVRTKK